MDAGKFDQIARIFGRRLDRRGAVAGLLALLSVDELDAADRSEGTAHAHGDRRRRRDGDPRHPEPQKKKKKKKNKRVSCPTGERLCGATCIGPAECCPACTNGRSCINGSCVAPPSCAANEQLCLGSCMDAEACCPLCDSDESCDLGTCSSVNCNANDLDACLDGVAAAAELSASTCSTACEDTESDACADCMVGWLLYSNLSLTSCYDNHCQLDDLRQDGAAEALSTTTCYGENPGHCCRDGYTQCLNTAESQLPNNILKNAAKAAAKKLLLCLTGLGCTATITEFTSRIMSAGLKAGAKYVAQISYCTYRYGCSLNIGNDKACVEGDLCCRDGQAAANDGVCCWPGEIGDECGTSNGELCCGMSQCVAGEHLQCWNRHCQDVGGASRAPGDQCCLPDCDGKCGGDDGCGGICPNTCAAGECCISDTCTPTCGPLCLRPGNVCCPASDPAYAEQCPTIGHSCCVQTCCDDSIHDCVVSQTDSGVTVGTCYCKERGCNWNSTGRRQYCCPPDQYCSSSWDNPNLRCF